MRAYNFESLLFWERCPRSMNLFIQDPSSSYHLGSSFPHHFLSFRFLCVDIKVFYCSRTHSQLSQMMDTFSILPYSRPPFHMRGVTLASRAQLCVNEKARSRASGSGEHNLSVSALNDICTEMQHRSSGILRVCVCLCVSYCAFFVDVFDSLHYFVPKLEKERKKDTFA